MDKEFIKIKDSINTLKSTTEDLKIVFHYTDDDKEIDAIQTLIEVAENYLEIAKKIDNIAYYLIETLGYSMQEVHVIANTSIENQDVKKN